MMALAQDTIMTLKVKTIDYGTMEKGADHIRRFKFTNMGNEPLIVKSDSTRGPKKGNK